MINNPKKLTPEDAPEFFESLANMPQGLKNKVDERMKEAHQMSKYNTAIARFMGWKDVLHQTLSPNAESGFKNEYYRLDSPDGKESLSYYWDDFETVLPYQKYWDWLMPVIIEMGKRMDLSILGVLNHFAQTQDNFCPYSIEDLFQAVVKQIQWYNETKLITQA